MKLYQCKTGSVYQVTKIQLSRPLKGRLDAFGLREKTQITVIGRKHSGTLILKVRGTRLALGHRIGEGIEVEERKAMDG